MLLGSALYIGGAERVIANLANYIDRKRFKVTICHLKERGHIGDELARAGHDVVGVARDPRGWRRYLSYRALAEIVRARGIELIHTHTHYALTDAALCRWTRSTGARLVHTFHFGNYPNLPRRYRLMEHIGARAADRLIAVGNDQRRRVAATYRLPEERLGLIPNGVEPLIATEDASWREQLRARDAVVVGTICTFIEQKGLPDLLKVARRVVDAGDNALFVVVGDGPLRPAIEAQCRAMGLAERVLFTGWKEAAARTMLPLFDIFFQPSLWEAMSMVVLEAMAAGKPVVATDVGDNRYAIRMDETGVVVPRGDVAAMASALSSLVRAPDRRRAFGEAGRRRFAAHYTVDTMTREYEALYLEVLSQHAGARRRATA